MKKNNKIMLGVGAGTAFLATCAIVKGIFDHKFGKEDLNEQEIPSVDDSNESEDRGVAPVNSENNEDVSDEVPNLKADAINHAYQPIKY